MGIFVIWAGNRGLNLTEQFLRDALGLPAFETVVSEKLDIINQKLDILIESPFRQARMHLLEGNIEKCKDKLIEAISLNELDLPAITLYSMLLYKSGNIPLALNYFEEIIRKFGLHSELFSPKMIEICGEYVNEDKPLQNIQPVELKPDDYALYPAEINCSLSSIIINWKPKKGQEMRGGGTYTPPEVISERIILYDWAGRKIKELKYYSIIAFTDEYLVVSFKKGIFFTKEIIEVYRTKDGSKVNLPFTVSAEQVAKLFSTDKSFTLRTPCWESSSIKISFAGAVITAATQLDEWSKYGGIREIFKVNVKPE